MRVTRWNRAKYRRVVGWGSKWPMIAFLLWCLWACWEIHHALSVSEEPACSRPDGWEEQGKP